MKSFLKKTKGVTNAEASFITGTAKVTYDPQKVTPTELVRVINGGTFYRASLPSDSLRTVVLKIEGMKNPEAAAQVTTVLNKLEGIEGGSLDIRREMGKLEFDSKKLTVGQILGAVDGGTPFKASVQSVSPESPRVESGGIPLRQETGWFGGLWRTITSLF